jgi:hypothetical protein
MEEKTPEPLVVSVAEGGAILNLGRTKMHSLIAEGRIRAVKVDGCVLIPVAELRRFIADAPAASKADDLAEAQR